MTEADDKANRRHLAALIGSRDTRWCEHIEQAPKVLDVQWDKLPSAFRRKWWRATDYGQHPPSPGTAALLPALLAAAQNKLEAAKAKAKTDTHPGAGGAPSGGGTAPLRSMPLDDAMQGSLSDGDHRTSHRPNLPR